MTHKDEAERLLELALTEAQDGNMESYQNLVAESRTHATLALVDAQEGTNELKRIEVLHAIAKDATDRFGNYAGVAGLFATILENPQSEHGNIGLKPDIAAALRIGGEQ